jgi:hypothetical protein
MFEVRADYDRDSIVVYQAYSDRIARPALEAGTFVAPFSFNRMTWIKPSFLWLMERSNWGMKSDQERILAVRMSRAGWDEALSLGVLTSWERAIFPTHEAWRTAFEAASVHVQWDPERSVGGAALAHRSIQVGISRHVIKRFTHEWIREVNDLTPLVQKLRAARGSARSAGLPKERPYPVQTDTARRLGMAPG